MLAVLATVASLLLPQQPTNPAAIARSPQQRFVDFSADLDRVDVVVAIGALGKGREGRREKIDDGKLGGGGSVIEVSGTQYFKATVTTPIEVRKALVGTAPARPTLQFELQIARMPDGKERRQLRDAAGTPIGDGLIGLFVLAPEPKGKHLRLLHVIAYDPKVDVQGEAGFGDFVRDVVAVNRHIAALRAALVAVDEAKDDAARTAARKALQELVDRRPEMLRTDDDALLSSFVAPLEERARKRLAG
ncbi:MAG: hypothetical protein IPK26_24190 [Planctomycetes bacterium]|nr:hypothetical protein [Planctomycetota bacterium]